MPDPLISVLMPVRNEEAFLHHSLGAVMMQDYPHLEILVIDGRSTDRTREIVHALQKQDPRICLLDNPGEWQSRALNIGLYHAKGDIIARVDGHTLIAPDYIRQCVALLAHHPDVDSVGGIQYAVGNTKIGQAVALSYRSYFGVPSILRHAIQDTYAFGAYMGVWRREILNRVGGWREDYRVHEDFEHYYRISLAGGKTLISLRAKSEYYCRDTWQSLWIQYFRYGRGKVKMLRDYPQSLHWRHIVAPLFVLAIGLGMVLSLLNLLIFIAWAWMLVLYAVVNLGVSLYLTWKNFNLIWRVMLAFVIIHCAWGLGFWVEVFASLKMQSKA